MNEANQISAATKLFGFIAEKAQSNRFSVTLNRLFKAHGDDAMIIPMNIREDDLYYTVSNMRSSQLKGAAIGAEYRHGVVEILDARSHAVDACGFCDILRVEGGQLIGDVSVGRAVALVLKEKGAKSLAILGSGALAKAVLLQLENSSVERVVLYNDRVESCMELLQSLGSIANVSVDIDRAAPEMAVDFSGFDAALNASPLEAPGALPQLTPAPLMIDFGMGETLFKAAGAAEYLGYEAMLPHLTQSAYDIWMN